MSISMAKWILSSLCASRIASLMQATFGGFPILYALLPSLPDFSSLEGSEQTDAPNCSDLSNYFHFPRCDLHGLLVEQIRNAFPVDS